MIEQFFFQKCPEISRNLLTTLTLKINEEIIGHIESESEYKRSHPQKCKNPQRNSDLKTKLSLRQTPTNTKHASNAENKDISKIIAEN